MSIGPHSNMREGRELNKFRDQNSSDIREVNQISKAITINSILDSLGTRPSESEEGVLWMAMTNPEDLEDPEPPKHEDTGTRSRQKKVEEAGREHFSH